MVHSLQMDVHLISRFVFVKLSVDCFDTPPPTLEQVGSQLFEGAGKLYYDGVVARGRRLGCSNIGRGGVLVVLCHDQGCRKQQNGNSSLS